MSDATFHDDLRQLPASCCLAFLTRSVKRAMPILEHFPTAPPQHVSSLRRLIQSVTALAKKPSVPQQHLEHVAESATVSRDYFRKGWELAVSGRLSDDGKPPKFDHPFPYLLAAICALAEAVHHLGQASLAFRDRLHNKLAKHGNESLFALGLSIESYYDFLRLSGGTPDDTFGWAEMILFDLRFIEAQADTNGWQDDTPMPETVVEPA